MTATNLSVKTNDGKKIMLNRAYKATPDYTVPSNLRIGIDQTVPMISSTALVNQIPIAYGTVCDNGEQTFTGSAGGDNSTDNTSTYKEGAGQTDLTAQNLIANDTDATKKWEIADLTTAGLDAVATKYIGCWFYIKDATALAKFLTSGTCLELRIGVDTTTNYYSQTFESSDLAVGWNWLCDNELLSTWTAEGTPGTLNNFAIIITTNNATDEFVAGDIVYDLLRQWEATDTYLAIDTLTIDETGLLVEMEWYLGAGTASGFLLNGALVENTDDTPLVSNIAKHDDNSKSDTDIFVYTFVDRLI